MGATVYTTAGGRRFHITPDCRALESAQALNDWDDIQPWLAPVLHRPEPRQPLAARVGYTACRVCVPPAHALPATGQTYGHEPVLAPPNSRGYAGPSTQVCARCRDASTGWGTRRRRSLPALWPCASATVLGLHITDADRWNARYPVGTPVTVWPGARGSREPVLAVTRTRAWRLGHGDSVVSAGCYSSVPLSHIDPRGGA